MSMTGVIKSIEYEALREVHAHEIAGINWDPIDFSTLGDKHVIVEDNEADRMALKDCLKEWAYGVPRRN